MKNIKITLTGTSPMLCHNPRLADPDDKWARDIKVITDKKTKTEDDRKAIERLEWFGGLYTDDNLPGPVFPTASIRKCFIAAAKIVRKGRDVERALAFTEYLVPIAYDGPRDITDLYKQKAYHSRLPVRIGTNRIMRVRPQFPIWSVVAHAVLLEDVMDFVALRRVIERAGLAEGLGDNRVNGYGRFIGEVKLV